MKTARPIGKSSESSVLRSIFFIALLITFGSGVALAAFWLPPLIAAPWLLFITAGLLALHWGFRENTPARRRRSLLRLRSPRPYAKHLLGIIPGIVLLNVLVVIFYTSWWPTVPQEEGLRFLQDYLARPFGWLPVMLFVAIYAPLLEELAFRGWFQGTLERKRLHPLLAIGIPALVFAALHEVMIPRILMGIIFGGAVYITRSLWAGIILHAGNNLIAVLLSMTGHAPGTEAEVPVPSADFLHSFWARGLLGILVLLGFFWLFRVARRFQSHPATRTRSHSPLPWVRKAAPATALSSTPESPRSTESVVGREEKKLRS